MKKTPSLPPAQPQLDQKDFLTGLTGEENPQIEPEVLDLSPSGDADALAVALSRIDALEEELSAWRAGQLPGGGAGKQARLEQGWLEFIYAHPDIKNPPRELPEEVWQSIGRGQTPCNAYLEYENRLLKARVHTLSEAMRTLEANRANLQRSPGSAAGFAAQVAPDAFVDGLIQGYR